MRCALYQVVCINVDKVAPGCIEMIDRKLGTYIDENENEYRDSEDDDSTLCSGPR